MNTFLVIAHRCLMPSWSSSRWCAASSPSCKRPRSISKPAAKARNELQEAEQGDVQPHQVPGAGDPGCRPAAVAGALGPRAPHAVVKLNKIYTRTGDDGTTGLVDGSRLPKHAPRMEAIGAVDEANAALGAAAVLADGDLKADLVRLPERPVRSRRRPGDARRGWRRDFAPSEMVLRIVPAQAEWLETRIDALNERSNRSPASSCPAAAKLRHACTMRAP